MKFIRSKYWFGYWWASICSQHYFYDNKCNLCRTGSWTKVNSKKLFGSKGDSKDDKRKFFLCNYD